MAMAAHSLLCRGGSIRGNKCAYGVDVHPYGH